MSNNLIINLKKYFLLALLCPLTIEGLATALCLRIIGLPRIKTLDPPMVDGRRQHGAMRGNCSPRFCCCLPDGFCPDHDRSIHLAMGQLTSKITIAVAEIIIGENNNEATNKKTGFLDCGTV